MSTKAFGRRIPFFERGQFLKQPEDIVYISADMEGICGVVHANQTSPDSPEYDIRTIQELLGHSDVSTTMIYTHVLNKGGRGVQSPLDGAY